MMREQKMTQDKIMLENTPLKENSEEKAYRLIIKAIKDTYRPGDFLLERNLAASMGMSRTPITIALNRLISEGILTKLPKKGCIIPSLDAGDAKKAFKVRKLMEVESGLIIAALANPIALEHLDSLISQAKNAVATSDFQTFTSLDEKFHHSLLQLAENNYLYESWKRIYLRCNIYTRYFDFHYTRDNLFKENTLNQHVEIVGAIKTQNKEKIISSISKHIDMALACIC